MKNIDPPTKRIREILTHGKGLRIDWFPEETPVSRLAETLVGMANSEGGTILIGITPRSGQIQGIQDPDSVVDRIFQAALLTDPPLVLPLPQVEEVGNDLVVKVIIPKGLPQIYAYQGRYLGRSGIHSQPLSSRQLRALLMERGIVQFETQIPPYAGLQDLDLDQISAYTSSLRGLDHEPFGEILLRRGCLKQMEGVLLPTNAALLLFGKDPQQWLPSASILATRFPGVSFSDTFVKQEMRGTLPEQIRQAETFVRDQMRSTVRLVGLTRQETPEYPLMAVRELLVNAVAHRDYNQQGDCIHLNIFADRLEIHSPGGLPGPVNLENLLVARYSRNAVIAQVLSDMGFVERLGYGLKRVVTVLRQNHMPAPRFEEVGGSFWVTLKNAQPGVSGQSNFRDVSHFAKFNLNDRQEQALGYLATRGRITNREYQDLCPDVSAETLRRDLVDLVRKGIVIKVGDRKSTYYIIK